MYMSIVLQSTILSINSKDGIPINNQTSSYLSNMNFPFKTILEDEPDILYSTISIQSVEMANSFYNINENNNKVSAKITILSSGLETTTDFFIPVGNYSASSFITIFNTTFSSSTGYTGTLALNTNNGIFSLTPNANTYTITILQTSTMYDVLGIQKNTSPAFTFGSTNDFSFACNFLGITKLKIFSNALHGSNIDSTSLTHNNLIDIISVSAPSYGLITYDTNKQESQLANRVIHHVDIRITDGDNNLVNFNHINWSITFLINTYRIVDVKALINRNNTISYLANEIRVKNTETIKKNQDTKKVEIKRKEPIDDELDILLS